MAHDPQVRSACTHCDRCRIYDHRGGHVPPILAVDTQTTHTDAQPQAAPTVQKSCD